MLKNLGRLVHELEIEVQHAPEILAHRDDFRNVVNRNYQTVARADPWPWLWDKQPLWALPDMSFVAGSGGVTMAIGGGPRSFNLARIPLQAILGGSTVQPIQPAILQAMVNGFVTITSADKTKGDGNWELGPFSIERMQVLNPDTSWTLASFDLDPTCNITSINGTEGGISMQFPRIQLPVECDALLAVLDQDGVGLRALTPSEARLRLWQTNQSGSKPSYALEDNGLDIGQPRFTIPQNNLGGVNFPASPFSTQRENWPFKDTFTVTSVNGSIPVGTRLQVFCSWYYGGRFGPPSNIVEYTIGDFMGAQLQGLPTLPQTTGTFEYGRRIAVFAAEDEGAFYFRGTVPTAVATTFDITTTSRNYTAASIGLRIPRWDEMNPGTYKYIRLFPRASGLQKLTCEFLRRPRQLVEDTDVPEMEEAFHDLLVWESALELATRYGPDNVMQRFKMNRDRILSAMKARYLPQMKLFARQKGMIGQPIRTPPFQTVNWHGDT